MITVNKDPSKRSESQVAALFNGERGSIKDIQAVDQRAVWGNPDGVGEDLYGL